MIYHSIEIRDFEDGVTVDQKGSSNTVTSIATATQLPKSPMPQSPTLTKILPETLIRISIATQLGDRNPTPGPTSTAPMDRTIIQIQTTTVAVDAADVVQA